MRQGSLFLLAYMRLTIVLCSIITTYGYSCRPVGWWLILIRFRAIDHSHQVF